MTKYWVSILITLGGLSTAVSAQTKITDVVNAASRTPTGFPSYGVAQGSLFIIIGTGLGPDQLQQATFPLPTTDGLAGVTVQIKVGGTVVDGIMLYAVGNELAVILPSKTPVGTGTVTVNNNGATATAPITVVASAPGLFTLANITGLDGIGSGPALAFNVNGDGSTTLNFNGFTAMPGQQVTIAATGVGAISSDETQSGVTDVPAAQLTVYVGTQQATGVSVARGSYPALPDGFPALNVPSGIAAVDLITFTVPDGIIGCIVSVAVQSGNFVSNLVYISVMPDGSTCTDPTANDPGDTVSLSGTARMADIILTRNMSFAFSALGSTQTTLDSGLASFIQYAVPAPVTTPVYPFATIVQNLDPGSCTLSLYRIIIPAPGSTPPPPQGPPVQGPIYLDMGGAINIKSPKGTMPMKKGASGIYSGSFATALSLLGTQTGTPFLDAGAYASDDGAGGADGPAFTATLNVTPPQLTFVGIETFNTINRSQGVTVQWTGGDPNGFITVIGTVNNLSGTAPGSVSLAANWGCSAPISAGQLTVPKFITMALPANTAPGVNIQSLGTIGMTTYFTNRFSIDTFDLALFSYQILISRGTTYQ